MRYLVGVPRFRLQRAGTDRKVINFPSLMDLKMRNWKMHDGFCGISQTNFAAVGVKIGKIGAPTHAHFAYMLSVPRDRTFRGGLGSRHLKVFIHASQLSALDVDFLLVQSFSMIIHPLLLVWWLATQTSGATLPPTLDLTSDPRAPNEPLADLQAQSNISAVQANPKWYCTKVDQWILPRLDPSDCEGVLDYFYIQTMEDGGAKRIEFLAPGAKKITHNMSQWTPRKYTFGSAHPSPDLLPTKACLSYKCCGVNLLEAKRCS